MRKKRLRLYPTAQHTSNMTVRGINGGRIAGMKTFKYLFVSVALLVLSSAAARAQTSVENSLAAAQKKWAMKKPKTYEFTVKFCVSCPSGVSDLTYNPSFRFRVENDDRIVTLWGDSVLDPFIYVR